MRGKRHDGWRRFGAGLAAEVEADLRAEPVPGAGPEQMLQAFAAIERGARAVLAMHDWTPGHGWKSEHVATSVCVEVGPDWQPDPAEWSLPSRSAPPGASAALRREGLHLLWYIAAVRAALVRGDAAEVAAAAFQAAVERGRIIRALGEGDRINMGFTQERRGCKPDVMARRRQLDAKYRQEGITSGRERAEMIADAMPGEGDAEAVRKSLRNPL